MKPLSDCKVLLVDDTRTNIDVLLWALRDDCKLGVALNGIKALEYIRKHHPDLILLDVLMPEMDGFTVCRELKADPATRDIPIIFITAMDAPEHKTQGFEMGAVDYIVKPFDTAEVRARVQTHLSLQVAQAALREQNAVLEEKVAERTRELEETQVEIIERLGLAAEYRDEKTGNHVKRVSRCAGLLGDAAGLDRKARKTLSQASTMHDVGKIGIPDAILQKPGRLTTQEYEAIKTHTTIGSRLLAGSRHDLLKSAEVIARTHHEWWNGEGYNIGLAGDRIPIFGRIVCLCDVFDALISERPYKRAWTVEAAFDEIRRGSGTHFDPELVSLFLALEPQLREIIDHLS